MKYVLNLIVSAQLLSPAAFAGEVSDKVLKVLKSSSEKSVLHVEEETFVFNINGYGCQWPGLRILNLSVDAELNHSRPIVHFGTDGHYLAIGLKGMEHQFCHSLGDVETVFGKELVKGAKLPMKVTRSLDLREGERMDKHGNMQAVRLIHETITVRVNGREVETTSEINLGHK